jgi:hypothetical protein
MNTLEPMMQFVTPLLPLREILASMWDENNYMRFLQPLSTLLIDKLTLCLLNNICILTNVVIVDPTWTYLFPWFCAIQGFVVSNAAQAKERSYRNWHPTDQFLPLVIEVFDCLHKHVDVFL